MMPVLPGQVLRGWRPKMPTSGSAQLPAEASVPSRVSTALVTKPVPRHSALVRVTHWITTLCFFALLVSGIEIVISHPRFYWARRAQLDDSVVSTANSLLKKVGADGLRLCAARPERLEPGTAL